MRRICLIFQIVVLLCVTAAAQNTVGTIVSLKGTARLRQVKGKVEILTEKNFARGLQPGQQLKADRNGQMQVTLCDGTRPIIASNKWYTVPTTVICSDSADSPIQRVLRMKFKIGARHRGENPFILFPIESTEVTDIVRPETVVLRWAPSPPAKATLSVSIIGEENTVWGKSNVPAEEGFFSDEGLRRFLEDVREKRPGARLRLKIRTTLNTENATDFLILSREREKALQQEIENLKEENMLLSHYLRAEIYLRYNLFIEAAGEYEEALKLSPESVELLKATAAIEDQAGNLARSKELENYAENLSRTPVPGL